MTNRYTHLTNRIRGVKTLEEKRVLYRRIRVVKYAILLALLAVLFLLVLMLIFFSQLINNHENDVLVVVVFTAALLFLVASLALFTSDMIHSLSLIREIVREASAQELSENRLPV